MIFITIATLFLTSTTIGLLIGTAIYDLYVAYCQPLPKAFISFLSFHKNKNKIDFDLNYIIIDGFCPLFFPITFLYAVILSAKHDIKINKQNNKKQVPWRK